MVTTMIIGSGRCHELLAGKHTATHAKLVRDFVSGVQPYYNAKASPIDQFRGGAILEDAYFRHLDDDWYTQYRVQSKEMDVLKCSFDFVKLWQGKIVDSIEMKSVNFDAFLDIPNDEVERLAYIKKKYKANYNQVQFQLYCAELESMTFKQVVIYDAADDYANETRVFLPSEEKNTTIYRDDAVINLIKERARPFQQLRDYYVDKL